MLDKMSLTLEMLTKAADLVETQEEQKRMLESPSPLSDDKKSSVESKIRESAFDGNGERRVNGTGEIHREVHSLQNGRLHDNVKLPAVSDSPKPANNHDRQTSKGEIKLENSSQRRVVSDHSTVDSTTLPDYQQYQKREVERVNGTGLHRPDENPITENSFERYHKTLNHGQTSPATDRGGDTHSSTKPMVILQHPAAATLSSVGTAQPVPLSHSVLHSTNAMHRSYPYPMMYSAGAPIDPALGNLNRVPGSVLKDGEGLSTSPNGSPNANLSAAAAAGMLFPASLMYPFANQALLMNTRAPGAIADIPPLLLAQSSASAAAFAAAAGYPGAAGAVAPNPLIEQYKRFIEGIQQFPAAAYSVNPAYEQYLKSLMGQGIDVSKEALSLGGMAARMPQGIPLAAIQAQPADMWMRSPEQLSAAMGVIRTAGGASPRSESPYSNKRREDSPIISNGGKLAPNYPYHVSLGQPSLSNLSATRTHARSPASLFPQGHRSRSPHTEMRKPEAEAPGYRSHSRDLDRDVKQATKELASTSAPSNHGRNNNEHIAAHSYSVTDETGRKIPLPTFYAGASVHAPHGYPLGLSAHHVGQERSPSPASRTSEDRSSYHRPSRDRSPGADLLPNKRRSLDSQYRQSPALNDRHNSRPTSPATNGHIPTARHPLVNGSAEALAELAKNNPHLLRSPNTAAFVEGREQRNGSPATNPYVPSYFAPHLLAGSQLMIPPQYAQALAASAKHPDLAALYKAGEIREGLNGAEYQRLVAGLPFSVALPTLPHQQQHILTAGRSPHALAQEYAALKAHPYFAAQANAKDNDKGSTANGRDKHTVLSQPLHHGLLIQQPPQALSPGKPSMKHSPGSQFAKPAGHHAHRTDSQSPPSGMSSSVMSSSDGRRYLSPQSERSTREASPKSSSKPYRPNSMLRQHAEDLERSRKRKLMEEEIAMGEEASNFHQGKQHLQQRHEQPKDTKKDMKRRKPLVTENNHDIEEHFRRSLGSDYKETANKVSITGSVEEHFQKALGQMWDKLKTTAPMAMKSETRDVAAPLTTRTLPSYSVAMSAGGAPPYVDGAESLARLYGPSFLAARERYPIQGMAPQHVKSEKSPPRGSAPTVLYPTNPPVGPVKQRVKAKAVFPEVPLTLGSDLTHRSVSGRSSLGSKGSTRSISGSSAESLPAASSKSSPVTSSTSLVSEGVSRASAVSSASIPYTYPHSHPHGALTTVTSAFSRAQPPVLSPNSSSQHRRPSSPSSPRPASEDRSRSPPVQKPVTSGAVTKETNDRQTKESGKPLN